MPQRIKGGPSTASVVDLYWPDVTPPSVVCWGENKATPSDRWVPKIKINTALLWTTTGYFLEFPPAEWEVWAGAAKEHRKYVIKMELQMLFKSEWYFLGKLHVNSSTINLFHSFFICFCSICICSTFLVHLCWFVDMCLVPAARLPAPESFITQLPWFWLLGLYPTALSSAFLFPLQRPSLPTPCSLCNSGLAHRVVCCSHHDPSFSSTFIRTIYTLCHVHFWEPKLKNMHLRNDCAVF